MARNIIAQRISSKAFTWTRDESGLGGEFTAGREVIGPLSRLYDDDSGSVGLVMISARTGREAVFALTSIELDQDGRVISWTLHPTFSSYNRPRCRDLQWVRVRIFN